MPKNVVLIKLGNLPLIELIELHWIKYSMLIGTTR